MSENVKKYLTIKNALMVLMVAALIWLVYLLLRTPNNPDSHKAERDRVIADNKAFAEKEVKHLDIIDSLVKSGKAKDSENIVLKAELKVKDKEIVKTAATATRLAKQVKELSRGDTSELGRRSDSLAEATINFEYLYNEYKLYSDSLTAKMEGQNEDYVKALEVQRGLYAELKRQHDALMGAYKDLFDDYAKVQKTVRRERLKTKIAALLGLIGGAAAVLK